MRSALIAALIGAAGNCTGGTGAPLQSDGTVTVAMHYNTTAGIECTEVRTFTLDHYVSAVRPEYVVSKDRAIGWCPTSELSVGGVVLDVTLDCTRVSWLPAGCSPDACGWTPP